MKNAKNGSTRSVVMCQKYFSPSPKICSGHAWTATESTCAIFYCVNFLNVCIVTNCLYFSVCMYIYSIYCVRVCCLLVAAEFLLFNNALLAT